MTLLIHPFLQQIFIDCDVWDTELNTTVLAYLLFFSFASTIFPPSLKDWCFPEVHSWVSSICYWEWLTSGTDPISSLPRANGRDSSSFMALFLTMPEGELKFFLSTASQKALSHLEMICNRKSFCCPLHLSSSMISATPVAFYFTSVRIFPEF